MLSVGTEAAKEHLRIANPDVWKNVPFGPPEYQNISSSEAAEKYPGLFDAVIASEVLEHVSDWEQLVSDASKCLKVRLVFIIIRLLIIAWWPLHSNHCKSDFSVVLAWYRCCRKCCQNCSQGNAYLG